VLTAFYFFKKFFKKGVDKIDDVVYNVIES